MKFRRGIMLKKTTGAVIVSFFIATALWCQETRSEILVIDKHWTQKLTITNPGSRSEGTTSKLFYNDEAMSPLFDRIVVGNSRFEFVSGNFPWDFKGYDRVQENVQFGILPMKIETSEIERGWYKASPGARKEATPVNWIWAGRENLELFFNPERMDSIAQAFHLQVLSYGGGLVVE